MGRASGQNAQEIAAATAKAAANAPFGGPGGPADAGELPHVEDGIDVGMGTEPEVPGTFESIETEMPTEPEIAWYYLDNSNQ